ncbi:MAG: ComEC/Rec2 family competence protein [Spirochaetales bacterium]|nr:ComEC/Rec2 family competence protein [Spirochaetales bacterium]
MERVRRPPSPALFLAVSLFGSTLVSLKAGYLPLLPLLAALCTAAAAAALLLAPSFLRGSGRRLAAVALLCLALGWGAGAARLWPLLPVRLGGGREACAGQEAAAPGTRAGLLHSGLPLSRVRRYHAVLTRDSSAAPGEAARYELRVTRVATAGGETVAAASAAAVLWVPQGPRLAAGRRIEVEGRLRPQAPGGPPALSSTVSTKALTVHGYASSLAARRAGLLGAVRSRLGGLEAPAAATLEALILGSREEISTELYEGFRASGSLHLLALSGLHAGILYLLVTRLLAFVRSRGLRSLAAAAVLVAYLFVAGPRPSLFRAVVMILAAVLGRLLDRDARPLNLLALAAAALILIDPAAVLTLSFQLSFLAVAGILVLSPGLQGWLEKGLPSFAAAALAYSTAAQAATAPLLLARFGVIHPIGLLAALPLIPLVTVFIWAGLGYLALAGTFLGDALGLGLPGLHGLLEGCVGLCARVPPLFGAAAVPLVVLLLGVSLLPCVSGRLPGSLSGNLRRDRSAVPQAVSYPGSP